MINDQLLNELKRLVTKKSATPEFIHHKWFVKYHLEIVESIALELCDKYPLADKNTVQVLVWLHDYEKIIDFDDQYNTSLQATKELMQEVGYGASFIDMICEAINIYNAKDNLQNTIIEIQIVSSSDAASHFIGPFWELYWYENPNKTIEQLQADNYKKATTDWDKKITLPEVKEVFLERYKSKLETAGQLPNNYLG